MTAHQIPARFQRRLLTLSAIAALSFANPRTFAAFNWTGLGADANWSTAANWNGPGPAAGFSSSFTFDGSSNTTSNNDLTGGTINGLTFNPTAAPFTLTGNAITASGTWTNFSPFNQTINLPASISGALSVSGNSGINFSSDLTTTASSQTLTNVASAPLTFSGNVFLGNSTVNVSRGNLTLTGSGDTTFTGTIANAPSQIGGLTLYSSGNTTIAGPATYTGNTTITYGSLVFNFTSVPAPTVNSTLIPTNASVTLTSGAATPTSVLFSVMDLNAGTSSPFTFPEFTQLSLAGNSGIALTINTLNTGIGTSGVAVGATLLDLSSSPNNSITVNHFGANVTLSNGILNSNSLAQFIVRDSTSLGFATLSGNSIVRIPDASLSPLPASSAGNATLNYIFSPTPASPAISVGASGNFTYNTITIDSSAQPATLNLDSNAMSGGKGLLIRGNHDVTINGSSNVTIGPPLYNYLSASAALFINTNINSKFAVFGPGLTVYSGATAPIAGANPLFTVVGGTFRFATPILLDQIYNPGIPSYMAFSDGAILEIGADLSSDASSDLNLNLPESLRLFGNSGFSAYGADRTVSLNPMSGQVLTWGQNQFLTTSDNHDAYASLLLSSPTSNATLIFTNSIFLGSSSPAVTRTILVADGSAPIDARITGALSGSNALNKSGTGTLELTGNNSFSGGLTISAGTLSVSADNNLGASPSPIPLAGGTLENTSASFTSTTRPISVTAAGGTLAIDAAPTFTLDASLTASGPLTLSGPTTIQLAAPINTAATITGTANLTVNTGASLTSDGIQLPSLTIAGAAQIRAASTPAISTLGALSITGTLDITNSKIIVEDTSPNRPADLAALRSSAGTNIFSSTANGQTIAIVDNAERTSNFPSTSSIFGGVLVDANAILITAAYPGDANLDGQVNILDLQDLANHWQQSVTDWSDADFNGDGLVDIRDLQVLANNWQAGVPLSSQSQNFSRAFLSAFSTPTPEPASLLTLAILPLLTRKRRRI